MLTYQFLRFEVKQVPAQHHPLRFDGSGKLRLRQLGYWLKEHEDAAIFAQRVGENARNLDVFLRHNGAAYEGDYDTGPARERLAALFGEGDRQLADLAAAVDAIYLFPSELA